MVKKTRTLTPRTLDAARVLGLQVARARRARGWTAEELAQRVGVSVRTLANLEHGSPTVSLGIAFEAATLVGVDLFGVDGPELAMLVRQGREGLALLPARVRHRREAVRDDF